MNEQSNIYLPHLMVIEKITHEAPGVKTFRLKFKDEKEGEAFHFKAGQFGEYSAFGEGESTFCIASSPTRKGYIECTFPSGRTGDYRTCQTGRRSYRWFSRTFRKHISVGRVERKESVVRCRWYSTSADALRHLECIGQAGRF